MATDMTGLDMASGNTVDVKNPYLPSSEWDGRQMPPDCDILW